MDHKSQALVMGMAVNLIIANPANGRTITVGVVKS
jgi:hypothetical protein